MPLAPQEQAALVEVVLVVKEWLEELLELQIPVVEEEELVEELQVLVLVLPAAADLV